MDETILPSLKVCTNNTLPWVLYKWLDEYEYFHEYNILLESNNVRCYKLMDCILSFIES